MHHEERSVQLLVCWRTDVGVSVVMLRCFPDASLSVSVIVWLQIVWCIC